MVEKFNTRHSRSTGNISHSDAASLAEIFAENDPRHNSSSCYAYSPDHGVVV